MLFLYYALLHIFDLILIILNQRDASSRPVNFKNLGMCREEFSQFQVLRLWDLPSDASNVAFAIFLPRLLGNNNMKHTSHL